MKKNIFTLFMSLLLVFFISQSVYASDTVKVEFSGHTDGAIPAPVTVDGVMMFPITEIFGILGVKNTYVNTDNSKNGIKVASFTYGNSCFDVSEGSDSVKESLYVPKDNRCINNGKIGKMDKPAVKINDNSVGVPLSFIQKIIGDKDKISFSTDTNVLSLDMPVLELNQVKHISVILKVNNPYIYVNDEVNELDPGKGSMPVIVNGRTLLPIGNIITEFGGSVKWEGTAQKVSLTLDAHNIDLWIGKKKANVDGKETTLDVAPAIINNRTMIPIKFASDNLGLKLVWEASDQIIALYNGEFADIPDNYGDTYFNYEKDDSAAKDQQDQIKQNETTNQNTVKQKDSNSTEPLDENGKLIHIGDIVGNITFSGSVKDIRGTKILVYWDSASFLVDKGKEKDTATFFGVNWLSNQWVEAKSVSIESSGY